MKKLLKAIRLKIRISKLNGWNPFFSPSVYCAEVYGKQLLKEAEEMAYYLQDVLEHLENEKGETNE